MHRPARNRESLRIRQVGTASPIGRLRGVLHDQLDDSPCALSGPVPCHCDTEVDSRRDPGASESIAIDADALVTGLGAELAQGFPGPPVYRSTVAAQQSGGPQQQGACADAAYPAGTRPAISQKSDSVGIAEQVQCGFRAAADKEDVRIGPGILETVSGLHAESAVRRH